MSVIDQAKAHFKDIVSGGMKSVDVPEWKIGRASCRERV